MKKSIIIIVPIIILLALLGASVESRWSQKTPPRSIASKDPAANDVLADDFKKMTSNLKSTDVTSSEWKKINDFSILPSMFVNKDNAQSVFKAASSAVPDLVACLKKDFCGMERRGDDDAYFDDHRTPAHILINRNLQVMQETLRQDPALLSSVDWSYLEELALESDEDYAVSALDILREFKADTMKTDDLIGMTKNSKGDNKANALLRISLTANKVGKVMLSHELENVFALEDNHTVLATLENLKKMALSTDQLIGPLKNLCRFKGTHNWAMVKYEANKLSTSFESLCN